MNIQKDIVINEINLINNEKEGNNINKNKKKILENVKSKYIIQIIFCYIDEKIKLKLI